MNIYNAIRLSQEGSVFHHTALSAERSYRPDQPPSREERRDPTGQSKLTTEDAEKARIYAPEILLKLLYSCPLHCKNLGIS